MEYENEDGTLVLIFFSPEGKILEQVSTGLPEELSQESLETIYGV